MLQRIASAKKSWLSAVLLVLTLALLCAGCTTRDANPTEDDTSLKTTTVLFQSIEDGLLLCQEGDDTNNIIRVRPNGLLSDATLRNLQAGDVLTVQYHNRTASEIDAADITVDPISGTVDSTDPIVPSSPSGRTDADTDESSAAPSTEPDEAGEATVFSPEDPQAVIRSLEEYFNDPELGMFRRQALTCFYEDPTQIDLAALFYNGTRDSASKGSHMDDLSSPEQEALRKLADYREYWEWADLSRFSSSDMDQMLAELFDLSYDKTGMLGLAQYVYLPEFDAFYHFHTDTNACVPIEILDILTDSDGYYYMTYQFRGYEESYLCCLYRREDSWKIAFHQDGNHALSGGAEAAAALQNQSSTSYNVLRPGVSDALEYAVSSVLLDEARAQMPSYADFAVEAHDLLHLQWQEDLLQVNAASLYQIYNEEEGELAVIASQLRCLRLYFWCTEIGTQRCYQLDRIEYCEDPASPNGIFSGEDWSQAAGLQLEDVQPALEAQCKLQSTSTPVTPEDSSEAFFAAMAGADATEAAENIVDFCGKQRHILHYQNLKCEIRQRDTNKLIEDLRESDLAAERGWDEEYLEHNIAVVQVGYSIEYNAHFDTDQDSGVYQQSFYVCRDPDSRLWTVFLSESPVKLVDYHS